MDRDGIRFPYYFYKKLHQTAVEVQGDKRRRETNDWEMYVSKIRSR